MNNHLTTDEIEVDRNRSDENETETWRKVRKFLKKKRRRKMVSTFDPACDGNAICWSTYIQYRKWRIFPRHNFCHVKIFTHVCMWIEYNTTYSNGIKMNTESQYKPQIYTYQLCAVRIAIQCILILFIKSCEHTVYSNMILI